MRQRLMNQAIDEVKKEDRISEVIKRHPESVPIMMKHGIQCVGCHANYFETIEQGAKADKVDDERLSRIIEEINKLPKRKKT